MNIFTVSPNPRVCAEWLDDLRLRKMIVETVQIISTAQYLNGRDTEGLYKPTHKNHPCCLWAAESDSHLQWLINLAFAYKNEYLWRFGKYHQTFSKFKKLREIDEPGISIPEYWPNCSEYKDHPVFNAYKMTLRNKWHRDRCDPWKLNPKWTGREEP